MLKSKLEKHIVVMKVQVFIYKEAQTASPALKVVSLSAAIQATDYNKAVYLYRACNP